MKAIQEELGDSGSQKEIDEMRKKAQRNGVKRFLKNLKKD